MDKFPSYSMYGEEEATIKYLHETIFVTTIKHAAGMSMAKQITGRNHTAIVMSEAKSAKLFEVPRTFSLRQNERKNFISTENGVTNCTNSARTTNSHHGPKKCRNKKEEDVDMITEPNERATVADKRKLTGKESQIVFKAVYYSICLLLVSRSILFFFRPANSHVCTSRFSVAVFSCFAPQLFPVVTRCHFPVLPPCGIGHITLDT